MREIYHDVAVRRSDEYCICKAHGMKNTYELISQQEDGLEGEFAVAEVEEVLEGRSEQVENHGVVVALGAEPSDEGNADTAGKRLVDTSLIFELRVLGLDRLKLDGNLLAGDDVGACGGC